MQDYAIECEAGFARDVAAHVLQTPHAMLSITALKTCTYVCSYKRVRHSFQFTDSARWHVITEPCSCLSNMLVHNKCMRMLCAEACD